MDRITRIIGIARAIGGDDDLKLWKSYNGLPFRNRDSAIIAVPFSGLVSTILSIMVVS